jgi:chorismate mutase
MNRRAAALLGGMTSIGTGIAMSIGGLAPRAHADTPSPLTALVDAAAQRLQTADPVAANKYKTGGAVDDPAREQQVIDTVTAAANAKHIDAGYVRDVFRNQIDATDSLEHSHFAQWKIDPASAPATAPELSASRDLIDKLNETMVNEIAAQWGPLHAPTCNTDLENAKNNVVRARQLDPLYQQALNYATHMYCR